MQAKGGELPTTEVPRRAGWTGRGGVGWQGRGGAVYLNNPSLGESLFSL